MRCEILMERRMAASQHFSGFLDDSRAVTLTAMVIVSAPLWWLMALMPGMVVPEAVSYTHLTLPTKA